MRVGRWSLTRVRDEPPAPPPPPRLAAVHGDNPLAVVQHVACAHFGVALRDLVGPSRHAGLVNARHVAMWVARELTNASLPQIGRAFGGRDHTTVLHAVRKIDALRAFPDLSADAVAVRTMVEAVLWQSEVTS